MATPIPRSKLMATLIPLEKVRVGMYIAPCDDRDTPPPPPRVFEHVRDIAVATGCNGLHVNRCSCYTSTLVWQA